MYRFLRRAALAVALTATAGSPAGSIVGKAIYEGNVPQFKPVDTSGDPSCAAHFGDNPPVSEVLVLGEGNSMANILVKVTKGLPDKKWDAPKEPVVMTQSGCRYAPHVTVVQLGQTLAVENPDGIIHNVNCQPLANPVENRPMARNLKQVEFKFGVVEETPFRFRCDVHPWMLAFCAVLPHPFFDVTGKDGLYAIEGLEPGDYEIEAWHERLGVQKAKVTVADDKPGEANFTYSKPTRK